MNHLVKSVIVTRKMNKLKNNCSLDIVESNFNINDLFNFYYTCFLCSLILAIIYFVLYFLFSFVTRITKGYRQQNWQRIK